MVVYGNIHRKSEVNKLFIPIDRLSVVKNLDYRKPYEIAGRTQMTVKVNTKEGCYSFFQMGDDKHCVLVEVGPSKKDGPAVEMNVNQPTQKLFDIGGGSPYHFNYELVDYQCEKCGEVSPYGDYEDDVCWCDCCEDCYDCSSYQMKCPKCKELIDSPDVEMEDINDVVKELGL